LLAVIALIAWRFYGPTDRPEPVEDQATANPKAVFGREFALLTTLLTIVFIGQSSSYYAVTAWLPEILRSRLGVDTFAAGGLATPFQLLGAVGALLVPILTARRVPLRLVAGVFVAWWLTLPLGMLAAPQLALLWACLAGAAQAGNFTILLALIANRAPSIPAARRSLTIVQTIGYSASAIAPTLLGALSTATGGWTIPLLVITGLLAIMGAAILAATGP
jgi:CP family cyanate transporter-like MFS transporter